MYIEEQIKETTEKLEKLTEKYNELGNKKIVKLYNATDQAIRGLKNNLKKLRKEYRIQQMATCYQDSAQNSGYPSSMLNSRCNVHQQYQDLQTE